MAMKVSFQGIVKRGEIIMKYQFEKNKLYAKLGSKLVETMKTYKCFIAGGTITSLFCNRDINDIDVYFRDEKSCIQFVEDNWGTQNRVNILTKKSVLMIIDDNDVQLIHFKFFQSPDEIFDTFDFTVCMGAFDFSTEQFFLHPDFMKHNSQRIIKFNKNTAFPIVTLLRVQKYKDKQYTISKPEFLRIALKCMDLNITTIDQLKDHLGGMYGINYDKIVNLEEGEEFSLDLVLDKLGDIALDEEYFKKPVELCFEELEDVIAAITKKPVKVITINNKLYRITSKETLSLLNVKPPYSEEISSEEYILSQKFYKFVMKKDGRLLSHYDKSFEYFIGKEATPKNEYLYFNEKYEIDRSSYANNGVLIEVEIDPKYFSQKDGEKILAKKCRVIREVPREEYERWKNIELDTEEELNDGDPFEL
jgi:hypothetical protein